MQQNKSSLPTPRRLEQRKWRKRCAATRTLPGNPLLIYWGKQTKQLRKELDDATEQQTVLINKLLSCCHEVRACSYPPRLSSLLNLPMTPCSQTANEHDNSFNPYMGHYISKNLTSKKEAEAAGRRRRQTVAGQTAPDSDAGECTVSSSSAV